MGFLIRFRQKPQKCYEHWGDWVLSESLEDTKDLVDDIHRKFLANVRLSFQLCKCDN